jgi:hypothetical protein
VRFSKRGVKKNGRICLFLKQMPVKKLVTKKLKGEILSPCHFPPSFFFVAILAVFLQEELKNAIQILIKKNPENLKNRKSNAGR